MEAGCVNTTRQTKGRACWLGRVGYFFSPTDLFLSLRSEDLHFLHLSAFSGFLAPHLRQTWRKSLRFWAICFFVASAMGMTDFVRLLSPDYKSSSGGGACRGLSLTPGLH